MKILYTCAALALASATALSFDEGPSSNQSANRNPQSAVRNPKSATAWRTLFDGKSLDAWKGYKAAAVPSGWKIADGALLKDTQVTDLVSKDEVADFELEL